MFTLYGGLSALSLAALLAVSCLVLMRRGHGYGSFIRFAVLCVPFALLGSRLVFCLANLSYYVETIQAPAMMLQLQDGGASITGALLGVILAAVVAARWARIPAGAMLDAAAFGMPLALVIERLAEPLCEMGWGSDVLSPVFDFLYDLTDGMHPVYLYEAVAALLIGVALFVFFRSREVVPGDVLGAFLVLYGCSQTVLESLRGDGHMIVIHFVRINQIAAIVMAVTMLVIWAVRCLKDGGNRKAFTSWALALVCILFGVVQEFAADGDENPYFSYTLVATILAVALLAAALIWFLTWRRDHAVRASVGLGSAIVAALLLLIERTADVGDHRLFFVYGVMAANLLIIGCMAFALRRDAATEE